MSDTDVAEILKLPVEERLRLAELIWESLVADPSGVPLGEAHRAVIDERLAEHDPKSVVVLTVLHTARDPKLWPQPKSRAR